MYEIGHLHKQGDEYMALKNKDIAELLGVSTATVSIVVNNKPGVSDKKRKEILDKIHQMGCDYLIRDEKKETKGAIGFIVYKNMGRIIDESPFFTYILEGITNSANGYGYQLKFIYLNNEMSEKEIIYQVKEANCDGMIIFGTEMQRENLQIFIDLGIPFCILDNSFQESDVDCVSINNTQGIHKAIQLLYTNGHQNIGYIKSKVRVNSFEERQHIFEECMNQLGLPYLPEQIVEIGYSELEAKEGIKEYLRNTTNPPTAFFVENDFLACNVMQGMQELGYQIPNDFSIVGFDDRPIAQLYSPRLTTINVPKNLFGPAAVNLLIDRIEKKRMNSMKIMIGTNLIERESVRCINKTIA